MCLKYKPLTELIFGIVSSKCDVTPAESKVLLIAIFNASSLTSLIKSAISFVDGKLLGNGIITELDHADFNGF
ncbi:hypothetical protein J6O48_04415 [bacterium]|nr:hypothetical protein [bacterium]